MKITSSHETTNASGNFTVIPGSQIHHEEVFVSGVAGTRDCLLTAIGLVPGALVSVRFQLPATAGIIIQMYDQTLLGSLLGTIESQSDGFTPTGRFQFWFDGNNFQRDFEVTPANGQQT
jgi:hypothetical protein